MNNPKIKKLVIGSINNGIIYMTFSKEQSITNLSEYLYLENADLIWRSNGSTNEFKLIIILDEENLPIGVYKLLECQEISDVPESNAPIKETGSVWLNVYRIRCVI